MKKKFENPEAGGKKLTEEELAKVYGGECSEDCEEDGDFEYMMRRKCREKEG